MKITVKFFVFDLPPGFEDAVVELRENAVVGDALDACLDVFRERAVTMDENELRTSTVLNGGRWVNPDDALADGDAITIIRPMDGG